MSFCKLTNKLRSFLSPYTLKRNKSSHDDWKINKIKIVGNKDRQNMQNIQRYRTESDKCICRFRTEDLWKLHSTEPILAYSKRTVWRPKNNLYQLQIFFYGISAIWQLHGWMLGIFFTENKKIVWQQIVSSASER